MNERSRSIYRVVARMMPRDFREAYGRGLEDAAVECLARERARLGRAGVAFAWARIIGDAITTRSALRQHTANRAASPPPRGRVEAYMDNLRKDLAYAVRSLRRQPGFTLITVLTLALGIGANTAIFSVINGVLLRPLAYPHPEQLEFITTRFPALGFDQFWMSPPEYLEFRDHNATFQSTGAYTTNAVNLGATPPTRPNGALVTPDFMPTLDVPPIAGRWFTADDSRPGADPVAILSSEIWRRTFGGDVAVVGRRVPIDGVSTLIVGVMPAGYDVHEQKVEVWQPLTIPDAAQLLNQRGSHYLYVIGRMKNGVSFGQAKADIDHMVQTWSTFAPSSAMHSPDPKQHAVRIDPLKQDIVGNVQRALIVLQAAVFFVLIIACANLANLLLARAESRQREFAVRAALGAGRGRLFAQFVTEGLVLAAIGSIAGVALAAVALRGLITLSPDTIPRAADITLDWRVLTFTLALAVVTGFVFGLAPLFHLGPRLALTLREGTRTTGGGARRAIRSGLVIAEVALAMTLVVGAGLLVRSFVNLLRVDAGFNRAHLVTFGVVPPVLGNPKTLEERQARRQRFVDFFELGRDGLAAIPGVQSVTAMQGLPPNRPVNANDTDFEWIPNTPDPTHQYPAQNVDYYQYVTQGFTETLGVPIIKGRAFIANDVTGAPVVLVNEALVRKFFKDRDPIGQRLKPNGDDTLPWFTIVGVLKDVKQGGVDAPAGTELYMLEDQLPKIMPVVTNMNYVMRTTQPIDTLAAPIRKVMQDLDPTLPLVKLQTMDDAFGESVSRPMFLTMLLGIFAGLALALAAIGTYGILSYMVSERTQEIGIRMALGADATAILRHFLARGAVLAGAGLAIGLVASVTLTRLMRTLLFGVAPTDPVTLGLVTGVIAIVATAACLIPAWRATRVDPLVVLRE